MALRARLAPPREARNDWPWHTAKTSLLNASLLFAGDRRMEAESFLTPGFATRAAIEAKRSGWVPLADVARIWQPTRLKGIQVRSEFGVPFLTATQVYDIRPVPRKWLSKERTPDHAKRVVSEGTILLSCSGNVGRATLARSALEGVLISHDLLRIEVADPRLLGWIYGYLRAPSVRQMMKTAHYGHIIKHLERHHLDQLPVVMPTKAMTSVEFGQAAHRIVESRHSAFRALSKAERVFSESFPASDACVAGIAFSRSAKRTLFGNRRRFDAWNHNPDRDAIENRLRSGCDEWCTLEEFGCEIWLPNRFKRIQAVDGISLVDSSQIFELNPDDGRRISVAGIIDRNDGFVEPGWLMMARSGQAYGLLGSVAMATKRHGHKVISDDVIRIAAPGSVLAEYLYVAMNHPTLGRPRLKALAYGSSIPHIDVEDLKSFAIPRLAARVEREIAALARTAVRLWASADEIERRLADRAEAEVQAYLTNKQEVTVGRRSA